jgi:hypothetical protein
MTRSRTFDSDLAARVAMEAMLLGVPRKLALAEFFDISQPRAEYILAQCRTWGYFGRDGHTPIKVTIRPKSYREQTWIACEECHHPWPCTDAFAGNDPYRVPLVEQSLNAL